MTRISLIALFIIISFATVMIYPVFYPIFIGDIAFHAALLFEIFPALTITLFIGSIVEELTQ